MGWPLSADGGRNIVTGTQHPLVSCETPERSDMIDQNLTQRAFTTILEHFVAMGRAPHYCELADALDIGMEEAREVQRAAVEASPIASCWLAHDTDHIESWAPFSNVPTHYLISVDGIQKWYGQ